MTPSATKPELQASLWVALGSALGGLARFVLTPTGSLPPAAFPWQLLMVNTTGCALIGFATALLTASRARYFTLAGVCGGFTSFSAFGLDTLSLLLQDQPISALLYVLGTVMGGIAAAWAGSGLAARIKGALTSGTLP